MRLESAKDSNNKILSFDKNIQNSIILDKGYRRHNSASKFNHKDNTKLRSTSNGSMKKSGPQLDYQDSQVSNLYSSHIKHETPKTSNSIKQKAQKSNILTKKKNLTFITSGSIKNINISSSENESKHNNLIKSLANKLKNDIKV